QEEPDDPPLMRTKQLCSTGRETKMVQPRTVVIPNNLKLSLENFMSRRMAVFHGLLTDTYKTLRETQLSSSPRKEPMGKTARQ
ncbi:hypothetical protein MC885_000732, partial [Smutsia gigantea]